MIQSPWPQRSAARSQPFPDARTLPILTNWPWAGGYQGVSGSAGAVQAATAPELRAENAVLNHKEN